MIIFTDNNEQKVAMEKSVGQLLPSKFGIQKLRKGKFLNYFVGIIFGNFLGNQNFISRKKNILME